MVSPRRCRSRPLYSAAGSSQATCASYRRWPSPVPGRGRFDGSDAISRKTVSRGANDVRVATHDRRGRTQRSTRDEHLPDQRAAWRHRSRDYWQERAERARDAHDAPRSAPTRPTIASCCASRRRTYLSSTISVFDRCRSMSRSISTRSSGSGISTAPRLSRQIATWRNGTHCSGMHCWRVPRWTACSTTPHVVVMDGDTYQYPPPAKKARRGNGRPAAG